ncbi:MAG TPA: carbohydrate ABC transporter permease [Anaerolineales bacterium]|nr:carbohydrate ABC transporter permease [Anaerolineales bacterium]
MEIARAKPHTVVRGTRRLPRHFIENAFWYVVLSLVAVITVFPFIWVFFTSFKGLNDPIFSVPPQLIPRDPTLENYLRVWRLLPVGRFYLNSILVTFGVVILNTLFASLAAYPLAKMQFWGRDTIFYLLLATYIVPPVLTSIPSFILAVKVFHYYDRLQSVIFPYLAGVLSIFLMRQAFKGVPDDLLDAGRMDGASEFRIWWDIVLPVVRPSLATVAIITFVEQWNNFFWPSLMLHTRENMTLQVGLVALQGAFANDARGIAAGVVMTVIPIIIFFSALQQQFVRGLTGAVKG